MRSIQVTSSLVVFLLPAGTTGQELATPARLREAAERGLKIVEKAAREYPKHRSCFSCHHQTLPLLTMSTAREKGLSIDRDLFDKQLKFTHESFQHRQDRVKEGRGVGGGSMTVGYGLWALEIGQWPRDETTEAMVSYLLKSQTQAGHWGVSSQRPPLEQSKFTSTILAVYYMRKFATEELRSEIETAASRARAWILDARPETHEDHVSRLGALPLLGAAGEAFADARAAVLKAQQEDGGWPQLPGMSSDAYATGFTLFTLQRIRVSTDHPAFRRGVKFLLETQCEDGSWHVKSRSKPIQVYFDNGDPHGKDQFISIPATSWATTALLLALETPKSPARAPSGDD